MTEEFFKYNRAYYIRFKKIDDEQCLQTHLFLKIKEILNEDVVDVIAIEEDESGEDNMVIFLNDIKLMPFINLCEIEEIIKEHYDITEELLQGHDVNPTITAMQGSEDFGEIFIKFFENNLTIDNVLEKISHKGLDSLNELEKKVLANG